MKQLINKLLAKIKSINYILVAAWVIPSCHFDPPWAERNPLNYPYEITK